MLDTRYNAEGVLKALVHWQDLLDHENTWKSVKDLTQQFPTFSLEDKLHLEGGEGSIDIPYEVYNRRIKHVSEEEKTRELEKRGEA